MSKSDMPLCQLWCLVTGLNLAQVFKRFLGQHTLIASTIDCQLSLEYNEFRPRLCRAVIAANGGYFDESRMFFLCINCLCNKICFRSLCCPLSVQNYHKLKRIHANIVQNPTFLGRFQTFGGQCIIYTVCRIIRHVDILVIFFFQTHFTNSKPHQS